MPLSAMNTVHRRSALPFAAIVALMFLGVAMQTATNNTEEWTIKR
jgi:hypothetical protein